ncbi:MULTISPECIES: flagellar basal body-associated protein FliL [unclassified Halomonas]|uniref:flagellar basal body-associated protein FliL n=1 Tax=unclassified Halomonas TaxID=2609666 RepID=UPI002883A7E5|nr:MULTISPECIES: flagellar basal body-associated protein FliL [unclassified Halomonas]MDT0500505.1 flagellar basal body-associated protein FliL [Halomonas sp. PAR7]MDT0511599.1 flagellar basal body-associated protein FliL [Halomonas sp. LES1]MDT0590113.1 flagellar basal body-associated protein FliL [Halomonas sp. PAR8]
MAKSAGGSRKLIWGLVSLLMLLGIVTAVTLFFVFSQPDASAEETPATAERSAPIFLSIEPFTVNLADDDYGSRLLYTGITLKLGDDQTQALLEEYMPQVRSRLLTLFSGQKASELTSAEGKQHLADDIITELEAPLEPGQPALAIKDVLFTEFIVQ